MEYSPYQLVSRISEASTINSITFFSWYWVTTLVLTTGWNPARSKLVLYLNPSPVCCCHGRSSFGFASRCNLWEVSIQTFRSFWSQITLSWMGKMGSTGAYLWKNSDSNNKLLKKKTYFIVQGCSRAFFRFLLRSIVLLDEKYVNGSKGFKFSSQC